MLLDHEKYHASTSDTYCWDGCSQFDVDDNSPTDDVTAGAGGLSSLCD